MVVPTLHVGQIVKYAKPLEGEEDLTFVLREHNGDRVLIASLDFPDLDLIRFRGQFPKGGYDVHNGRCKEPAASPTVHG